MDICTAMKRGYFRLIRFLIDLCEHVDHRDEDGRTPLTLCALIEDRKWQLGLAHTLLEKSASVGIRDKYGMNALHYACLYDCVQLVDLYLKALDYDLNMGDKQGHSALFYAVNSGSMEAVRSLIATLTKYGLSVDKASKLGITPLMQAYKTKRFDIAQLLIEEGCADEDLRDKEGKSAREMAEEFHQIFITEQKLGIRRARSALRTTMSTPPRRIRQIIDEEEAEKKPTLLPMQRSANKLIHICKDCDVRSNPSYMFNLTPTDLYAYDPSKNLPTPEPKRRAASTSPASWRDELLHLYKHLEVKHSSSYRETVHYKPRAESTIPDTDSGNGLRIPGSDHRFERRGSTVSVKSSTNSSKLRHNDRLAATTQFLKRRGSIQSATGKRQNRSIPVVKEPQPT